MSTRPRIVSLCPSNTELVWYLGLADCLVAVDNYSDWPLEVVNALPRVGPDLHIDIEKVRHLRPDLVLCSLSVPGMESVVEAVHAAGLPHIVFAPHRLEDIYRDLESLALAVGDRRCASTARLVTATLRNRVERIHDAVSEFSTRPVLYWEWWPQPVFSPARDNWLTELSDAAGARNLFAEDPGDQVQDSGKRVIAGNPDFFFAVWTGVPQHKVPLAKLLGRPGWDSIRAVQTGHVFVLSEGLFCRPSPRLIDGLEQITGLIRPGLAAKLGLSAPSDYGPVRLADGTWLNGITP